MTSDFRERRRFRRHNFSSREEDTGAFTLVYGDSLYRFTARILNISEGGLGLSIPKSFGRIQAGDIIVLTGVLGHRPLGFLAGARMKIMRVQELRPRPHHNALSCEFVDATDPIVNQIRAIIAH